jgi:hypothetical protein
VPDPDGFDDRGTRCRSERPLRAKTMEIDTARANGLGPAARASACIAMLFATISLETNSTLQVWGRLMNVLVTGAAGYIGSMLMSNLRVLIMSMQFSE